jgi:uncharacterized protein (TIGR02145 family)
MEYVEGETLKEYIDRKGKLKDEEIKHLFSQMLEAMAYVHKQNLVHRDIKPSNFMIDQARLVKLMDFGIAKTMDASSAEYTQTGTGMQMGTPMYMSPEQITETKSVTAQSDIYSLGVVLWQMVTGQKPYDTNTLSNFQLQTKIVNEKLELTNSKWDIIIQKAAAKVVLNRYNNCIELIQTLNNPPNKSDFVEEDKTILSDNIDKTVVEEKIKVKKTVTVSKKKNPTINTDSLQNVIENKTQKSSKYWHVLWLLVPVLIRAIMMSSNQNNEASIPSVVIGEQEWMETNLNVETFRNGDVIPEAKTDQEWEKAGEEKKPAWCYFKNNSDNSQIYGKLYNGYAVYDSRGLAPKGWRIPSTTDWNILISFLGGVDGAGAKLTHTSGWMNYQNNVYYYGKFNLPYGYRSAKGVFEGGCYWFSSSLESDSDFEYDALHEGSSDGNLLNHVELYGADISIQTFNAPEYGEYIRCIKEK